MHFARGIWHNFSKKWQNHTLKYCFKWSFWSFSNRYVVLSVLGGQVSFFSKFTWSKLLFKVIHGILRGENMFDPKRWLLYGPLLGVKTFKGLNYTWVYEIQFSYKFKVDWITITDAIDGWILLSISDRPEIEFSSIMTSKYLQRGKIFQFSHFCQFGDSRTHLGPKNGLKH